MTRDEQSLRLAYIGTFNRHWRTALDRSGPTPAFLDELVEIAVQHAAAHATKVTARQALRAEAATTLRADYDSTTAPPAVAGGGAGTAGTIVPLVGGGGASAEGLQQSGATGGPGPSHRTRTRTRRTAD